MNKQILCVALVAMLFASCKKYPDGPWVSFRSRKARLEGKRKIEQYLVNGIDSTNHLPTDYELSLTGGGSSAMLSYYVDIFGPVNEMYNGTYSLINHDTELSIHYTLTSESQYQVAIYIADVDITDTYKILKLESNSLWLQKTVNNKVYEYHFAL